MKRTIIAAALIAGAFMSAHADYAASDNIYGIINIPIVPGMNAVGVSLLPMDPAADRLHDVILPEGLTAGTQEEADGLYAVCIQHEMDHLNGVLFIDHLSRLKRERAVAKVKKAARMAA